MSEQILPEDSDPAPPPPPLPQSKGALPKWTAPGPSRFRYVLRMALLSFVPAMILASLLELSGVLDENAVPEFEGPPVVMAVGIVLIAPLLETLLMAFGIWVLGWLLKRPLSIAIGSSLIWAVLHSLDAWAWGIIIAWPFFVFSSVYLACREKSWGTAYFNAALTHMAHNLVPGLMVVFSL